MVEKEKGNEKENENERVREKDQPVVRQGKMLRQEHAQGIVTESVFLLPIQLIHFYVSRRKTLQCTCLVTNR